MRKILVVGGAGYVGSVLSHELLERGFAVRVLDRLYFGDQGIQSFKDRVELVVGDMRSLSTELVQDVDAVVNLGGLSNDPTAEFNPKANYEMNTVAGIALAKLAKEEGVQRYIYASSCSIYDRGVTDEEHDVVLDESAEVNRRQRIRARSTVPSSSFCPWLPTTFASRPFGRARCSASRRVCGTTSWSTRSSRTP